MGVPNGRRTLECAGPRIVTSCQIGLRQMSRSVLLGQVAVLPMCAPPAAEPNRVRRRAGGGRPGGTVPSRGAHQAREMSTSSFHPWLVAHESGGHCSALLGRWRSPLRTAMGATASEGVPQQRSRQADAHAFVRESTTTACGAWLLAIRGRRRPTGRPHSCHRAEGPRATRPPRRRRDERC